MKKLTLLFTLTFSMLFSSTAFAEWTKVYESPQDNEYYIDFDRIRKDNGFVYYWTLSSYLEPVLFNNLSVVNYRKGDCKMFRYQDLRSIWYKQEMAKGDIDIDTTSKIWRDPKPNSNGEALLNAVCK